MNNAQQQFFDTMKSFVNPQNWFSNLSQIPAADFSAFANLAQENGKVLSSANQLLATSAQSIVKRSAEILQATTTEMFNAAKEILSAQDMEQASARQQQCVKHTLEHSMNHTKEIAELASKASMEALQLVYSGVTKSMNNSCAKKCNNAE